MAERFSNNAVGTLAASIDDAQTSIELEDEPGALNFVQGFSSGDFQRATITHPADPDVFEIVHITNYATQPNEAAVVRGQEDTAPRAWAAGATLSARVTAHMLRGFLAMDSESSNVSTQDATPGNAVLFNTRTNAGFAPVQIAGYPILPLMTAKPINSAGSLFSADGNMGREAVGGTVMVDLGDDVPTWSAGASYPDGAVVMPPTLNDRQYMFQAARGWETSQTATAPEFEGTYPCDAFNGGDVVGQWVPVLDPVVVNLSFHNDYRLVLSEVGFICFAHDASTAPAISVGTPSAPTRFASGVSLTGLAGARTVHRIQVTDAAAMVGDLRFALDTAASGSLRGRFYWRGFFVQVS